MEDIKAGDIVYLKSDHRKRTPMTIIEIKRSPFADKEIISIEVNWLSSGNIMQYRMFRNIDPLTK